MTRHLTTSPACARKQYLAENRVPAATVGPELEGVHDGQDMENPASQEDEAAFDNWMDLDEDVQPILDRNRTTHLNQIAPTHDDLESEESDGEGETPSLVSRDSLITESFSGDAGTPIGKPEPGIKPTRKVDPSMDDPDTWELARWLMTSGISAGARNDYLSLRLVSNTFANVNGYHLAVSLSLRTAKNYPGRTITSSSRLLTVSPMGQGGNVSSTRSQARVNPSLLRYGCATLWSASKNSWVIPCLQTTCDMPLNE